ncbi:3-keto-disaccharide hydrolase [Sunxiuqinia dokdonensis]|uniref:Glycosyl hydrolase n=1 Tax=Sunxiuqinia dokdonensis TaxID=1409788 RepID=A0A0L8V7C4_9BACT|nr:DUF1080 domain-containing protein [Sunxiuqinia dokdonensis]KOH44344.1 glycosyl hydrolase [Sunxiuqinia dokdonensis]
MNFKKQILTKLFLLILVIATAISCKNQKEKEQTAAEGFTSIFNGKTLDGWHGDSTYWRVEDGHLVGEITPSTILDRNTFIIWQGGSPENFELKLEYRISERGNSGINYRSEKVEGVPFALRGYQFDLDGTNRYTGQNYEERGRTTLAYRGQIVVLNELEDSLWNEPLSTFIENNAWTKAEVTGSLGHAAELNANIKSGDWNLCHLVVDGNRMKHYVNGVLMSDVTDNDSKNRKLQGMIGVQVHVGPPMKVEFRNIWLKNL